MIVYCQYRRRFWLNAAVAKPTLVTPVFDLYFRYPQLPANLFAHQVIQFLVPAYGRLFSIRFVPVYLMAIARSKQFAVISFKMLYEINSFPHARIRSSDRK